MLLLLLGCVFKGPLPPGTWAGEGYVLKTTAKGAELSASCAHGSFEGPLVSDDEGRLEAPLGWEMDQGDINEFDSDRSFEARIEADVKGPRLRGTLIVNSFPEHVAELDLRWGRLGSLGACEQP